MPFFYLCLASLLFALVLPSRGRADVQVAASSTFELGTRSAKSGDEFQLSTGLRMDAMFGAPRPMAFRIGPALELRSANLATFEGAVGAGILIPLPGECPIGLTGLVGAATRRDAPDGYVGVGTISWGLRRYNKESWYGYALNLFVTGRKEIAGDDDLIELSAGVELDIAFTVLLPGVGMTRYVRGEDPLKSP